MDILQIQSLTVGYGAKAVLENISLTAKEGEFISVVAPNGTGKTTLLKTIAGVLLPINGSIHLNGKNLSSYSRRELARQIAVVGADILAPGYDALQMVLMGRFPHSSRFSGPSANDHAIVEAAMEDVDIWHKRRCQYSELSQGERQKVIIARALAQQPQLLLLDEPTAHLDIANQFAILQLIKQAALQTEMAVIAVIHDINLALEFSTKLLFVKNSQVLAYGNPEKVATTANLKELYGMDFTLYHDAAATYVRPNLKKEDE